MTMITVPNRRPQCGSPGTVWPSWYGEWWETTIPVEANVSLATTRPDPKRPAAAGYRLTSRGKAGHLHPTSLECRDGEVVLPMHNVVTWGSPADRPGRVVPVSEPAPSVAVAPPMDGGPHCPHISSRWRSLLGRCGAGDDRRSGFQHPASQGGAHCKSRLRHCCSRHPRLGNARCC